LANTITLKRRIGSVKNTRQITKAMELVAASKMRRAQESALRTRDYYNLASQILTRLRQLTDVNKHPLYKQRTLKTRLIVFITSDRGLAGAYNSNLLRLLTAELTNDRDNGVATQIVAVGRQGSRFLARFKGVEVIAAYHNFPDHPTPNDMAPILATVTAKYLNKEADAVDIIYTDYKSSLSQIATLQRLLPAAFSEVPITQDLDQAVFEPSPEEVLNSVTQRLIEAQMNQAFLESFASEHSMRMLAMKNATDNASDLIDDLTLEFNTARQAAITQELAEITGGAEAIK
jgi:F-type H+-transporting ATPase subunit gamma